MDAQRVAVRRSAIPTLVFTGQVGRTEARRAVVAVERVLMAAPALSALAGQSVAVELDGEVPSGSRWTFACTPLRYGETLLLRASLAPVPVTHSPAALLAEVRRGQLAPLAQRAEAVIVGRVQSLAGPRAGAEPALRLHAPRWYDATVKVERVVRGQLSVGQELHVLSTASQDVAWAAYPRLRVGDESLMFLVRGIEPQLVVFRTRPVGDAVAVVETP